MFVFSIAGLYFWIFLCCLLPCCFGVLGVILQEGAIVLLPIVIVLCLINDLSQSQFKYQRDFLKSERAVTCSFSDPIQKNYEWFWEECAESERVCTYKTDEMGNRKQECRDECIRYEWVSEIEYYVIYKASYFQNGVQKYGCACASSFQDQNVKTQNFQSHNFEQFDDGTLKYPSWSCYPYNGNSSTLKDQDYCYVRGDANKYQNGDDLSPACFPTHKDNAVIVFNDLKVGWWGVMCLQFFLMLHIILCVLLCMPAECWAALNLPSCFCTIPPVPAGCLRHFQ